MPYTKDSLGLSYNNPGEIGKETIKKMDATKAADLGLNDDYQSLLDANPYREYNYTRSKWDAIVEWLGFRSKAMDYRDQLLLNANEYDSQIALKAQQEGYDSAQQQAERMRAAGINPDLQGVTAGSSSGVNPDAGPMVTPGADAPEQAVGGIVSTVISAFSGAFGLVKDMQGLKAMRIANDQGQANVLGTYMKQAEDYVMNAISKDDRWEPNTAQMHHDMRVPKRYRAAFDSYLDSFYNGIKAQGNLEESIKAWQSNRRSNAMTESSRYYDDAFDVLKGLNQCLQDFADDTTYKRAQNASTHENTSAMSEIVAQSGLQNEYAYNQGYSGSKAANADNESNDARAAAAKLSRQQQAANRKIVDFLEGKMNDGNIFAGAMLLIYNLLSSGGMSNFARMFGK